MIKKVEKTIYRHGMFMLTDDLGASEVVVALSGGADSVALLYAMLELSPIGVKAAHLNHCLRGAESDEDERFCKELCKKLSVPLITERIDINAISAKTGESTELCARNQRYDFLNRVAGEYGVIVTAHTADDNLETVIFNLARGTGISGLGGIPPVRDNIRRPLIYCRRAEIEEYLNSKNQAWRNDSTNSQDEYTRNFIRHNISPKLEQLNPLVKENVAAMCEGLRQDAAFINMSAEELIDESEYNAKKIAAAPKSVAMAAISLICKKDAKITPERKSVQKIYELCKANKGKYNFEGNSFAAIEKGKLVVYKMPSHQNFSNPLCEVYGKSINGWNFSVITKQEWEKFRNVNKKFLFSAADCDKLSLTTEVKNYQGSGEIRIAGRNCTKSVGKLLNECGVAERDKGAVVILEDEIGPVMVCGHAVSERVKIDGNTKSVLLVKKDEEFGENE